VIGLSFAFYAGAYTFLLKGVLSGWRCFSGHFFFSGRFSLFLCRFGANSNSAPCLRFPLSLRAFYIIGLAYGFADFSALASVLLVLL